MKTVFRLFCAILTWVTIIGQYIIMARSGDFGSIGAATLTYLGYFTVLTNILAALAFTTPFLKPGNTLRQFFDRQAVRAAIALYILVVMVVYWALLASIHDPTGWSAIFNVGLHLVIPVLFIFDWIIFSPKGNMSYKHLPYWTIYPVAYGLFNIARGLITGFYPYPFLDVSKLGYGNVFVNMLGFMSIYLIGGAAFITIGWYLSRNRIEGPTKSSD